MSSISEMDWAENCLFKRSVPVMIQPSHSRDGCEGRLTPLRELEMMRWMNVVTDKENWDVKVTMNRFLMEKRGGEANRLFQ